jgi:hypothetical protein
VRQLAAAFDFASLLAGVFDFDSARLLAGIFDRLE